MTDPRYKALLIGNGTFDRDPHKLAALKGPANDIRILREALTHPENGLFDAPHVRHMLDGTNTEVLEAIEMFFNDAGPEDHLLFYYSGHGYPDTNNNLYLCARNTRTNLLTSSAVPDKAINLMAENCRARKFIFILDCCHSGGFKGGSAGLQLAHGSGRCLITSCASDQLSADSMAEDGASTFTHHLADALTSGEVDTDGDGVVLTSEIFKYVQPRVYAATKQTVQWTMDKTFGEAAIARARPRKAPPGTTDGPHTPVEVPPLQPPPGRPMLEVSESRVEFREIQPGEVLPVERIDVYNSGDGTLDWEFNSEEAWIQAERSGEALLVRLEATEPGMHRGNIFVRDRGRGGSRTIRVLLHVVAPEVPKLVASPRTLDFGTAPRGHTPKLKVNISNAGPGRLYWEVTDAPSQLVIERHEHGFKVELAQAHLGRVEGTLRIKSNGGDVDIPVTASVLPPLPGGLPFARPAGDVPGAPPLPQATLDPAAVPLLGWWMNDNGAIHVKHDAGALVYTDHNLLAIKTGQGVIRMEGGVVHIQGSSTFSPNYTGQLTFQGGLLTGTLVAASGQAVPVLFMRKQPWFATFVR